MQIGEVAAGAGVNIQTLREPGARFLVAQQGNKVVLVRL
jgi:hypothetical protein